MRRLIFVVVAVAALAAAVAGVYYARVDEKYRGYSGTERFVEIAPGTGSRAIGKALVDAGVVRDEWTFRLAVLMTGTQRELKAGEYRFTTPASAKEVARKLARGDVFLRPITFPEGLSLKEMASIYQSRGLGTSAAFLAAARNTSAVKALDPAARDLEGYLFPDPYNVPRKMSADALVQKMVQAFLRVYGETVQKEVEARGGTLREVVTLASIVEKEAAQPDERPIIAAVYQNRLRIGMGLQCDPTVIYALEKAGRYTGNLTKADLKLDSPYNTSKYPGQ